MLFLSLQVDPQSLKGTLLIQYKHDVNWLLGNLNKIGAIFVNGVRYPPDKNGQAARQGPSTAYQESRSGTMTATSPHLQHMANQVEFTLFLPFSGFKILLLLLLIYLLDHHLFQILLYSPFLVKGYSQIGQSLSRQCPLKTQLHLT